MADGISADRAAARTDDARGAGAATERRRARLVAAAVGRAATESGVALDDGLLIWSLAGGRPADAAGRGGARVDDAGDHDAAADVVATALERATDNGRRRAQGLHVTPRWLAERLVNLALGDPGAPRHRGDPGDIGGRGGAWPTVCDPACGGGAFLVAAARHLHRLGVDRRHVVRHLLWGADVDPVGLAAAEAALALWAGERPTAGHLVVADPLRGEDVWAGPPPGGFDAVVGNPPFQSQLGRATARTASDQRRLRERFGPAIRAYTDTAWLFLLLGCNLARPGGRVVLVEPQSVVAARDAEAVRAAVDRRARLRELWVDDGRVFSAAVRVCAPVLERRPHDAEPAASAMAEVADRGAGDRWGRLWARALDLPLVEVDGGQPLGERAAVVAGFRDQYYGLVDVVREHDRVAADDTGAPLVTSGALDWASCAWGERPVRFAKRRWRAPVVDLDRLATDAPPIARRWVARTRAPKLVVATQTRVVEAAVDTDGTWVPSVPTLAVVPVDADDLWRLAAAVLSPAATAWLVRRAPGTALDRGSLRVAGPDLAALPLPADAAAWDAAAVALQAFVAAPCPVALDAYLDAAAGAYGTDASLTAWWRHQAGTAVRSGSPDG